jgi:hypothetical protein
MINISKCLNGINLKDSSLIITSRPLHINSSYNNGILCSSSNVNINADAITGSTFGTAFLGYNNPTTLFAQNSSTIESFRDTRNINCGYGVNVISNSTAKIEDSIFAARDGITGATSQSYSAILSQASFVQAFGNSITGYGGGTAATGAAAYRANLTGVIIVESTANQNLISLGMNSSGVTLVDATRGTSLNPNYTAPPDDV